MKKEKIVLILLLALIPLVGTSFASLTEGNFKPYYSPTITIFSPSQNQVYHSSNVLLNVSLNRYDTFPPFDVINSLNYSLDGQQDRPLPYTISCGVYCNGKTTLSSLPDGPHSIFVHSEAKHGSEIIPFNATVSFTIETTIKQMVKPLSLPFWAIPLLSTIIVLVLALTTLVVLYRRRKRQG
jgi:hypothetical protein